MAMEMIDVAHISRKGVSYRTTIPKAVAAVLGLDHGDIIALYNDGGKVVVEKVLRK